MFENIIHFKSNRFTIDDKENHPIPCKLNIPDWYKNLSHNEELPTIKGCIPFLETLTSGYLLKMPRDYYISHNSFDESKKRATKFQSSQHFLHNDDVFHVNINSKNNLQLHSVKQLGKECPFTHKNKDLPFHKILNPWIIQTPPGYSCLFLPPLNNTDDRFSIIPGIVDTDTFLSEVNFPFIVNGDKYPILETTIKKNTPYVQVIPFKRDNWKMKIEKQDEALNKKIKFKLGTYILHNYKRVFWSKRSWK